MPFSNLFMGWPSYMTTVINVSSVVPSKLHKKQVVVFMICCKKTCCCCCCCCCDQPIRQWLPIWEENAPKRRGMFEQSWNTSAMSMASLINYMKCETAFPQISLNNSCANKQILLLSRWHMTLALSFQLLLERHFTAAVNSKPHLA